MRRDDERAVVEGNRAQRIGKRPSEPAQSEDRAGSLRPVAPHPMGGCAGEPSLGRARKDVVTEFDPHLEIALSHLPDLERGFDIGK